MTSWQHCGINNITKKKRSIIRILNTKYSMCLARAICVGKVHLEKNDSIKWKGKWKQITAPYRQYLNIGL